MRHRIDRLAALLSWLDARWNEPYFGDRDVLAVGDVNVRGPNTSVFDIVADNGFAVPSDGRGFVQESPETRRRRGGWRSRAKTPTRVASDAVAARFHSMFCWLVTRRATRCFVPRQAM
jgi:hypothetical protein